MTDFPNDFVIVTGAAGGMGAAIVKIVAGNVALPDYPSQVMSALDHRKIGAFVHAAGVSSSMADGKRVFEINFMETKRLSEAVLPNMASGAWSF